MKKAKRVTMMARPIPCVLCASITLMIAMVTVVVCLLTLLSEVYHDDSNYRHRHRAYSAWHHAYWNRTYEVWKTKVQDADWYTLTLLS